MIIVFVICLSILISSSIGIGIWIFNTPEQVANEDEGTDEETDEGTDIGKDVGTDLGISKKIKTIDNKCLVQNGNNIKVDACNESDINQLFIYNKFTKQIISENGKCVDVARNSKQNNAKVILYKCKSKKNNNQIWDYNNNTFKVKHSNKCLEFDGKSFKQFDCNNSNAQKFYIE